MEGVFQLHDVRVAAQRFAVSPWTVRSYIRSGKLRAIRIGRLVRIEEQEIQRFIAQLRGDQGEAQ
jgi:excisionase family DNA binding protein